MKHLNLHRRQVSIARGGYCCAVPEERAYVMSAKNVQSARDWLGSIPGMPAEQLREKVAQFFDADGDYYPVRKFPEARPCHGHQEITKFFAGFMTAWSHYEVTIRRLIAVADDRILACERLHAEGHQTGASMEGDLYQCMWMRHGRCFRMEDHLTVRGALRALGLEGETLEAAGLEQ
jgi:SnoaL-like domain